MTTLGRLHNRRSIRLRGWDYASPGAYFVTVCTHDRGCLLGDIRDGEMHLSPNGEIVADAWRWLAAQHPYVALDEWCVMPNHLHGILIIGRDDSRTEGGGSRTAPTEPMSDVDPVLRHKSLGRLVGAFKTISTKQINLLRQTPGAAVWQRDFWDRVVRDGSEMYTIREYIRENAANWPGDSLNA